MATKLTKAVKRETDVYPNAATHQPLGFGKMRGRKIIVIIEPPNLITFRLKGTRQQFTTNVESCFRVAQYQELMFAYKKKKAAWDAERKLGSRKRKPTSPYFPLGL